MSLFRKGLSDPLVQATSNIISANPKFSVGDDVVINQGPNTGKNGKVVGIKSSGYSDVQLNQGRYITISNEYLGDSTNILTEKKKLDSDNKKDFFKKKFSKKSDDDDDSNDDSEEKDDDDDESSDEKNGKKGKKGKGKNGEKVEINPDLDEIQDHQRRANIIQSARAISLVKGIIGNR